MLTMAVTISALGNCHLFVPWASVSSPSKTEVSPCGVTLQLHGFWTCQLEVATSTSSCSVLTPWYLDNSSPGRNFRTELNWSDWKVIWIKHKCQFFAGVTPRAPTPPPNPPSQVREQSAMQSLSLSSICSSCLVSLSLRFLPRLSLLRLFFWPPFTAI